MARTRSGRRQRAGGLCLFGENISLGWKMIREVSRGYGESRVAAGTARQVFDPDGRLIGYQVCEPERAVQSIASDCVLTLRDIELITFGTSRTASLSEEQKQVRVQNIAKLTGRYVPADDAVELARAKVAAYGHGRLVCVHPKG